MSRGTEEQRCSGSEVSGAEVQRCREGDEVQQMHVQLKSRCRVQRRC